mgnify:FL=1
MTEMQMYNLSWSYVKYLYFKIVLAYPDVFLFDLFHIFVYVYVSFIAFISKSHQKLQ